MSREHQEGCLPSHVMSPWLSSAFGAGTRSRTRWRADSDMKALLLFIAWCVLLTLSWPIALVALIAAPVVWLLSLPLRLIGVCVESILALLRAVLLLPARVLGHRG
jgi:hypothetical protein